MRNCPKKMNARVGDRVKIVDLVKRPDLNGTVCVVWEAADAEGKLLLVGEHGRVKVAADKVAVEDGAIDWTFAPDMTFLDAVLYMEEEQRPLGDVENSLVCMDRLRQVAERGEAMAPASHLDRDVFFSELWPQTNSHFVLFLGLASVGHNLCAELYEGRCRVYQAYFEEYTAYEWATCTGRAAVIPACQVRGGGHEMDWGETKEFFEQLFELMQLSEELAAIAYGQIGAQWEEKETAWKAATAAKVARREPVENTPLAREMARYLSGDPAQEATVGFRMAVHPIVFLPESQLQFHYPEQQAHRFCFLYEALTGVPATATQFLCMLLHRNWRSFGARDDRGRPTPVGWTIQGGIVTKEK